MPFQPVANAAQALINYRQAGQALQSQLYFRTNESESTVVLNDIAQMVADWLNNSWAPVASTSAEVVSIIVTDVSEEGGEQITFTPIGALTGDIVSPPMPTGTTITASWRTGLAGRSYRGRTYHVGLTEQQVVANSLDSGSRTALQGAYAQLIIDANVNQTPLVVASRVAGGAPRPVGVVTDVLTVVVDEYIDSQRRRLTGRGR